VSTGKVLQWPIEHPTAGIGTVFPSMRTDIVLDRRDHPCRLVIDTKFTNIFGKGWYRDQSLKTRYTYQLYGYLRSHEGRGDPWADHASGILLHPAINAEVDESVLIQGHHMRFATVDQAGEHAAIKQRLLGLIKPIHENKASGSDMVFTV
jgi:5-methylcytosine-specific restriction enzyme subunit McrC